MSILATTAAFLLVLSVLVIFHECGHFLAARLFKLKVDEFGFGFPPRLFGKKYGETLYSVNAIPLGGFVRIKGVAGDDPDMQRDKDDRSSFSSRSPLVKIVVLTAGIMMNLLLSVLLFSGVFMLGVPTTIDQVTEGAVVSDQRLVVTNVGESTPAQAAGVMAGDVVLSVDGAVDPTAAELQEQLGKITDAEVELEIKRGDENIKLSVTPGPIQYGDAGYIGIGVGIEDVVTARYGLVSSVAQAVKTTLVITKQIFVALVNLFLDLFLKAKVSDDVSGPIGIAVLTGQVASLGATSLLQFMAVLSINLALFNLLPIPALDGGRLLSVLIELVRGKPVNEKVESLVHSIGFGLLLLMVVFVTFRDIGNFF